MIITAAGVYVLCLLGAAVASKPSNELPLPGQSIPPSAKHPTLGSHARLDPPWCGFAINLHYTDRFAAYLQAIDEIAQLGLDSIEIVTPAFQTHGASQEIRIESGPGRGPWRWQIVTMLEHARSRGLRTTLMPVVLFTEPRDNEWRGKIHPHDWDQWWRSYREMVDYFLDIAVEARCDVFCVGSELLSTEKQLDRWRALIAHARGQFDGKLTYSTNWDHYHVSTLWRDLDMIGISGYWDITTLTDPDHPDPDALTQRWRQIRDKILAFAQAQRRPVLFTEIGYPSLPWALKDPWNYVNSEGQPSHPQTQVMGYDAFLTAWSDWLIGQADATDTLRDRHGQGGPLAGVFFYAWDPYHVGGPTDTGYGVRGKPALDRLRKFLALRENGRRDENGSSVD